MSVCLEYPNTKLDIKRILTMTWSLGIGRICKERVYVISTLRGKGITLMLMPSGPSDLNVMHSVKLLQFSSSFLH